MQVFITTTVEDIAKRYKGEGIPDALKRLSNRLKQVTIEMVHPSVMERIGFPFFKRRERKFRIMGKVVFVNINSEKIPIMVIWQVFPRDSPEYNRFMESDKLEREEIASKYLPSEDELKKIIEFTPYQPQILPPLPDDLSVWLMPFSRPSKEVMIFETRNWVRRFEEIKYKELASNYYNLLKKIVDRDEEKANFGYIEKPFLMFAQDEDATIYYAHLLVDVSELPSEEIILLLDASDSRNPKLEKTFKDGLNGKGAFSWLSKIGSESITSKEQLNTVSRQSGRAYYAYILADQYLWRLVEGINEPKKKWEQLEGFDVANPALSVEEMLILNQTKYETNKVVLPLFINGRAGSGKSTMLYHLFAEYVMRKLKYNPPGKLLFLTYTKDLLEESKKTVKKLLEAGREFIGESVNSLELNKILEDSFQVFSDFLLNLIPQEERIKNFPEEKFIAGFGDFLRIYNDIAPKGAKLYSPDISWYVIRTYIKGYKPDDYLDPEEYDELPEKERSVPLEIYRWVWEKIWPKYKEKRKKEKYWDTQDLVRYLINENIVKPEYAVIFCDEAQDFTRIEQHFLWKLLIYRKYDLKKHGKNLRIPLVFAGDPFQTINPTGFRWEALESGFYTEIIEALDPEGLGLVGFRHEDLSFNYRSTAPIVRFANLLQMWRKLYFKASEKASGKILQTPWREDEHIFPPRLYIINKTVSENKLNELLKGEVVILPCEYGQEQKNNFIENDEFLSKFKNSKESPSFLSPMEAKGLEFQRVWIYKFGEHCPESFIKILSSQDIPYDEQLKSEYFLNKLYVSVTRARKDLIVIDTEKGEERLWNLTKNPQVPEEYKNKVEGLTLGDHYGLKGFEHIDPLEIASQLSQADDPKLLRQASDFYRRAGRKAEAIICEARAFEIEKQFDKAGRKYLSLNDISFFSEAEKCFWKGKMWGELNYLYNELWKDGGDSFYRISTHLMLSKDISKNNLQEFFEKFERRLSKQSRIIDQKATQEVLKKVIRLLLTQVHNSEYKHLLRFVGTIISRNPALTFIIGNEESAWIFYHAGMLKEAVEQWDNIERKPQEYYISKAKIARNLSEKIYWLFQGKLFKEIVDLAMEIKNIPKGIRRLSEEDYRLIINSFIKLGKFDDAVSWCQQNGFYEKAFEILKKYWYKIENNKIHLEQFLLSLFDTIRKNPSDEYFNLAENVIEFIQRHIPLEEGKGLIRSYWDTLIQIKRWKEILKSFGKLRGEYGKFARSVILEMVEKLGSIAGCRHDGFYKKAFDIIKNHWGELKGGESYLAKFFHSLLKTIERNPRDECLRIAEDTVEFIQKNLPAKTGIKLIKEYCALLLQIKRWREVLEIFKKLQGEYAQFGQAPMLEEIARHIDPEDKTIPKKDIVEFMFSFFSPQQIQSWIKSTSLELVSAVVERLASPPDILKWYEKIEVQKILSDEQIRFVRLRWLKIKERRLQYLNRVGEVEKYEREKDDFEEKLSQWEISFEEVEKQPIFPAIRESLIPIQVRWDGRVCCLTFNEQMVIVDVGKGLVTGFNKVKIEEQKINNGIGFFVKEWELKGEMLFNNQLILYYKGKFWRQYKIENK